MYPDCRKYKIFENQRLFYRIQIQMSLADFDCVYSWFPMRLPLMKKRNKNIFKAKQRELMITAWYELPDEAAWAFLKSCSWFPTEIDSKFLLLFKKDLLMSFEEFCIARSMRYNVKIK